MAKSVKFEFKPKSFLNLLENQSVSENKQNYSVNIFKLIIQKNVFCFFTKVKLSTYNILK